MSYIYLHFCPTPPLVSRFTEKRPLALVVVFGFGLWVVFGFGLCEFPNDGAGLFKWLKVYGDLKVDSETKQGWINEWNEATMTKVGIPLKPHGIWLWLEWVEDFGKPKKLNATLIQKRKKLLEGFPDSFDNVIAQERIKPDPGSYTIPANYPAHHPKSGSAHPNRGQPDLFALVTALEPEWTRRCKRGLAV